MQRHPGALTCATILAILLAPNLNADGLQQVGETLPVQVVLYSDADTALVRQPASVRLARGRNTISFTWSSDNIQPGSIRLHLPPELTEGELMQPASGGKSLQWVVTAPEAGDYPVMLTWQLKGVAWSPTYRLVWAPEAAQPVLRGFLTITNNSGVRLDPAKVQIVLGRPGATTPEGAEPPSFPVREVTALPPGTAIRATFLPGVQIDARMIYRVDSEASPETARTVMLVDPPREGALGTAKIPGGPLTVVLGPEHLPAALQNATLDFEPAVGFELDLGEQQALEVERTLLERQKIRMQFDRLGQVSGFDTVERYAITVRNFMAQEAEIELRETVVNTWEFETEAQYVTGSGHVSMSVSVPPQGEERVEFTLTKHSGTRIP